MYVQYVHWGWVIVVLISRNYCPTKLTHIMIIAQHWNPEVRTYSIHVRRPSTAHAVLLLLRNKSHYTFRITFPAKTKAKLVDCNEYFGAHSTTTKKMIILFSLFDSDILLFSHHFCRLLQHSYTWVCKYHILRSMSLTSVYVTQWC